MRTIQMTLDDALVETVDAISQQLNMNRSSFTRKALRDAIEKYTVQQMEQQHREGYRVLPVKGKEFSVWEDEQAWGDE